MEAAFNEYGYWSADDVPVNAGGTASFYVTAYPPGENPATASGGNRMSRPRENSATGSGNNSMNPSSPSACNLVVDEDKPARFYVAEYHEAWDHRISNYTMPRDYPQTEGSTNHWADGLGGSKHYVADFDPIPGDHNHYSDTIQWPADVWVPSLPSTYESQWDNGTPTTGTGQPPSIGMEHCDRQVSQVPWGCVREAAQRTADAPAKYSVGGKALSGDQYFVKATAYATAYANPLYTGTPFYLRSPGDLQAVGVPSTTIVMDNFGRLGTDGQAPAVVMAAGSEVDATMHVQGTNLWGGSASAAKWKLVSQTVCTVPTNTARLTIGIGEQVRCSITPSRDATWKLIGAGSLSATSGPSTILTASLSPTNSTVIAQIDSATQALAFKVVAPSGVGNVSVYRDTGWGEVGTNTIGAMTTFWFSVLPTNVSFANVHFRENLPASPIHHWPSGLATFSPTNIVLFGSEGDCAYADSDDIGEGPWGIGRLNNGTNYANFSYSLTWTNEYLNASSNWIPFATMHTTTEFRGSDQKCRETYQDVPGEWQGPWAETQ